MVSSQVGKSPPYYCFEDLHVPADHGGLTFEQKLASEYAGFPNGPNPFILRTLYRSWTSYDIAVHLTTIVLEEHVAQRTVYVEANTYGMETRGITYFAMVRRDAKPSWSGRNTLMAHAGNPP